MIDYLLAFDFKSLFGMKLKFHPCFFVPCRTLLIIILLFFSINICFSEQPDNPVIVFHDSICIKPHKGYHYKTCHNITVTIDHFILIIPKNYDTDLASIPRWLWNIISPARSDFIAPSILHDYLYACNYGYKRSEVDEIFYQALVSNGVSKFTAFEMYAAVRIFGNSHFNKNENCDIEIDENIKNNDSCYM